MRIIEQLLHHNLADKVFTIDVFEIIFGGSKASQYGLINKALARGDLIALKRGIYLINQKYNFSKISKNYIASQLHANSYISLESALSYHGWIPEHVTVVTSVIKKGRSKEFMTPFGEFTYYKIPIQRYQFTTGVQRAVIDNKPFLIASGMRALLDLVYEKKFEWRGLDFIEESLRIDIDNLAELNEQEYQSLRKVYKSKKVLFFLDEMYKALKNYG